MALVNLRVMLRDFEARNLPIGRIVAEGIDASGSKILLSGDTVTLFTEAAAGIVDGVPDRLIELPATDGSYAIRWKLFTADGELVLVRHTSIPLAASVDFGALQDVLPDTLQPSNDAVAAWLDVLAQVTALRAQVATDAATATSAAGDAAGSAMSADESAGAAAASASTAGGSASTAVQASADAEAARALAAGRATSAGNSATAAAQSATGAETARTGAETASTAASTARTGAETAQAGAVTARTGAETARTGAEAARDLALAGQFAGTAIANAGVNAATLTTPGVYRFNGTAAAASTNLPTTAAGVMIVTSPTLSPTQVIQQYHQFASAVNGRVFWEREVRENVTGGPWRVFAAQRVVSPADQPGIEFNAWDDVNLREQGLLPIGTDLLTVDLNLVQVPGAYRAQTSTNATLARNYPAANIGGLLEVYLTSTNVVMQRFTVTHGAGGVPTRAVYQRRLFGGSWDTWRMIPTVRWDQTAGRAAYMWDDLNGRDQLIYGDTGWRIVTSLAAADWTSGTMYLRRNGYQVELGGSLNTTSGAIVQANTPLMALPVGYRPAFTINKIIAGGNVNHGVIVGTDGVLRADSGLSAIRWQLTWMTSDAWPNTLPGSASGTIPNA